MNFSKPVPPSDGDVGKMKGVPSKVSAEVGDDQWLLEGMDRAVLNAFVFGDQAGKVYRLVECCHWIMPDAGMVTDALGSFDKKRGKRVQIGSSSAEADYC